MDELDDDEEWVDVPGHEGLYRVSSHGRVLSVERAVRCARGERVLPEQVLNPQAKRGGYLYVLLYRRRRRKLWRLHRLVLTAFVGPPPRPGMEAMHMDDPDPANCRLDNLEWGTPEANREERLRRYAGLRGDAQPMGWMDVRAFKDRVEGQSRRLG